MTNSRRKFLALGAGALCGAPLASAAQEPASSASAPSRSSTQPNKSAQDPVRGILDYARSYVTFIVPDQFNFARLQIDSRCILLDAQDKVQEIFYRFESCKSENTHGTKDLFQEPNYDFSGVFSPEHYVLFRVHAPRLDSLDAYAERGKIGNQRFEGVEFGLRYEPSTRVLESNPAIIRATRSGAPLVGRTEIRDDKSGRRAILEYPVKTMNVNLKRQIYQVDTGPLAFPDFKVASSKPIEMIELAFVAYNRPDEACFVIQRPTPLGPKDGKNIEIYHYSQTLRTDAKNTLYAVL